MRTRFRLGDGYVVVFPLNLKTLDERLAYSVEHFKKLRDRVPRHS